MLKKLETLKWYLQQPKGLSLIINLVKRNTIYKSLEKSADQSMEWCRKNAITTYEALQILFPDKQIQFVDVAEMYSKEFSVAKSKMATTPFKMGGMGNIDLLYNVCELMRATFVAETGVAYGWSSLAILLSISKRVGSKLISTDMPYAKMGNENYVGIVVPENLRPNWLLIQESDTSGLPKGFAKVPHLDIVHYDSDKSYLGRKITYPILYDKLKKGGLFISDDIGDNISFKHFCEKVKAKPLIIQFNTQYVGLFIK